MLFSRITFHLNQKLDIQPYFLIIFFLQHKLCISLFIFSKYLQKQTKAGFVQQNEKRKDKLLNWIDKFLMYDLDKITFHQNPYYLIFDICFSAAQAWYIFIQHSKYLRERTTLGLYSRTNIKIGKILIDYQIKNTLKVTI